jgi:hypothetical protein
MSKKLSKGKEPKLSEKARKFKIVLDKLVHGKATPTPKPFSCWDIHNPLQPGTGATSSLSDSHGGPNWPSATVTVRLHLNPNPPVFQQFCKLLLI